MIKIKNLSFNYGDEKILDDFSCEFEKGERVCISAPSGRGKTTLLRLISGLEKPKQGKIEIHTGTKLSVVFQDDILLPWYTAKQNVAIVSSEETAKNSLDKLGLSAAYDKLPRELSGGMQRRVELARALAHGGNVLILDEAFKGLDDELKNEIMQILIEQYRDKLIIFTSHDKIEQEIFATRTIKL
ncbi:MAG: ATP-binding cassette domain-containing protein [Clostridia bacterium]